MLTVSRFVRRPCRAGDAAGPAAVPQSRTAGGRDGMLRISGEDAAVRALLGMLQDAASLGALEPGTPVRVSKRSSATLHRRLLEIVQDDWRPAEVQAHAGAIDFGKY